MLDLVNQGPPDREAWRFNPLTILVQCEGVSFVSADPDSGERVDYQLK